MEMSPESLGSWDPTVSSLNGIKCRSSIESNNAPYYSSEYDYDVTSTVSGLVTYTKVTATTDSQDLPRLFRKRNLLVDNGDDITTLHQYSIGTFNPAFPIPTTSQDHALGSFVTAGGGSYLLEIITRGQTSLGVPELVYYDSSSVVLNPTTIGGLFEESLTREVLVHDQNGRLVCKASQVRDGDGYAVATATVWTYASAPGGEGTITTEIRDGRVISIQSKFADGSWEEKEDETGSVETTQRDLLGRVTTVTSSGDGNSLITRRYSYQNLTTLITTSGGGLSLKTKETRDLRGRIVSSTNETGATTDYEYPDGGRRTQVWRLGSMVEETSRHLDGRFKSRSGAGVISRFATYDTDSSGNEIATRSTGATNAHSPRKVVTVTSYEGKVTSIRRPGPPNIPSRHPDITKSLSESYDSNTATTTKVEYSSATGLFEIAETDLFGNSSATGVVTHGGSLGSNPAADRYTTHARTYEKRGDYYWEVDTRTTRVTPASNT
ncbi:MAG: hypothetical protein EOP84_24935, partial [Verrucomicrobiaceae bacterium]